MINVHYNQGNVHYGLNAGHRAGANAIGWTAALAAAGLILIMVVAIRDRTLTPAILCPRCGLRNLEDAWHFWLIMGALLILAGRGWSSDLSPCHLRVPHLFVVSSVVGFDTGLAGGSAIAAAPAIIPIGEVAEAPVAVGQVAEPLVEVGEVAPDQPPATAIHAAAVAISDLAKSGVELLYGALCLVSMVCTSFLLGLANKVATARTDYPRHLL
jgi:hypothetical protein